MTCSTTHLKVPLILLHADLQLLLEVVNGVVEELDSPVQVKRLLSAERLLINRVQLGQSRAQVVLQGEKVVVVEDDRRQIDLGRGKGCYFWYKVDTDDMEEIGLLSKQF